MYVLNMKGVLTLRDPRLLQSNHDLNVWKQYWLNYAMNGMNGETDKSRFIKTIK